MLVILGGVCGRFDTRDTHVVRVLPFISVIFNRKMQKLSLFAAFLEEMNEK